MAAWPVAFAIGVPTLVIVCIRVARRKELERLSQ
jgi:hypothetical protein